VRGKGERERWREKDLRDSRRRSEIERERERKI
jgi:hypothetical protein